LEYWLLWLELELRQLWTASATIAVTWTSTTLAQNPLDWIKSVLNRLEPVGNAMNWGEPGCGDLKLIWTGLKSCRFGLKPSWSWLRSDPVMAYGGMIGARESLVRHEHECIWGTKGASDAWACIHTHKNSHRRTLVMLWKQKGNKDLFWWMKRNILDFFEPFFFFKKKKFY
jgi:hypothetical protein